MTNAKNELKMREDDLTETQGLLKKAQEDLAMSEEDWFAGWHQSKACIDYNKEVGDEEHKMEEDEASDQLKGILIEDHPNLFQAEVWFKYQQVYNVKNSDIRAEMMDLDEVEDDDDQGVRPRARGWQGASKSARSVSDIRPPSPSF